MTFKRELIALVVRILAKETSLIRMPTPFEQLLNQIYLGETFDQRIAREIENVLDEAVVTARRVKIDRQFKEIVRDF